ncbi:MAG: hypothetical protein ACFFFH_15660 [Candidatus Thorarchaeota archaeon]
MVVILDIWLMNPLLVGGSLIALMYVNMYLLKYSNTLRKLGYILHFKQPFYVSNPSQREIIEENRQITLRHWKTRITQIVVVIIFSLTYSITFPIFNLQVNLISETILGFFIGSYINSILQLLGNIYLFRFITNYPQSLKGKVTISDHYLYRGLKQGLILNVFIWLLIFIFVERVFFLGACLNQISYIIAISRWEKSEITSSTGSV